MAQATHDLERWLPAAREGSSEALGQALETCRGYLLAVAERELDAELRAKGGASDLVQQTFMEAQQDFGQFHGDSEGDLVAWLRRMLINNMANFRRSHTAAKRQTNREVSVEPPSSSVRTAPDWAADTLTPSRKLMEAEEDKELHQAIGRLPEDYRRVIHLRYREEKSFAEIAELMGRSENAVEKLWLRAVQRLQQELPDMT